MLASKCFAFVQGGRLPCTRPPVKAGCMGSLSLILLLPRDSRSPLCGRCLPRDILVPPSPSHVEMLRLATLPSTRIRRRDLMHSVRWLEFGLILADIGAQRRTKKEQQLDFQDETVFEPNRQPHCRA